MTSRSDMDSMFLTPNHCLKCIACITCSRHRIVQRRHLEVGRFARRGHDLHVSGNEIFQGRPGEVDMSSMFALADSFTQQLYTDFWVNSNAKMRIMFYKSLVRIDRAYRMHRRCRRHSKSAHHDPRSSESSDPTCYSLLNTAAISSTIHGQSICMPKVRHVHEIRPSQLLRSW